MCGVHLFFSEPQILTSSAVSWRQAELTVPNPNVESLRFFSEPHKLTEESSRGATANLSTLNFASTLGRNTSGWLACSEWWASYSLLQLPSGTAGGVRTVWPQTPDAAALSLKTGQKKTNPRFDFGYKNSGKWTTCRHFTRVVLHRMCPESLLLSTESSMLSLSPS